MAQSPATQPLFLTAAHGRTDSVVAHDIALSETPRPMLQQGSGRRREAFLILLGDPVDEPRAPEPLIHTLPASLCCCRRVRLQRGEDGGRQALTEPSPLLLRRIRAETLIAEGCRGNAGLRTSRCPHNPLSCPCSQEPHREDVSAVRSHKDVQRHAKGIFL